MFTKEQERDLEERIRAHLEQAEKLQQFLNMGNSLNGKQPKITNRQIGGGTATTKRGAYRPRGGDETEQNFAREVETLVMNQTGAFTSMALRDELTRRGYGPDKLTAYFYSVIGKLINKGVMKRTHNKGVYELTPAPTRISL